MFTSIDIDGNTVDQFCDEPPNLRLDFDTDNSATHRCLSCESELVETAAGFESNREGLECWASDTETVDDDGQTIFGAHDPEPMPLSWCNSAAIYPDEQHDCITVSISIDDPRGAFTLEIRRIPDDADGSLAGELVMHVPYAGELSPHMRLTQIHDGTFVLGEQFAHSRRVSHA